MLVAVYFSIIATIALYCISSIVLFIPHYPNLVHQVTINTTPTIALYCIASIVLFIPNKPNLVH